MNKSFHWADQVADKIIKERKKKVNEKYVCSAGVTPSGTVHIGNFREIITTDLIVKALKDKKKKVNFVYYWDDYDRLRKIPSNVPGDFKKYIGMAISEVSDPFKCHKSYAEHFEKEVEESLPAVGIKPEFIRQSEQYKKCEYAEEIKTMLQSRATIRRILDRYRKEPLGEHWYPIKIYCENCKKDSTTITNYDDNYKISYKCSCGYKNIIDFRKKGIVKLIWRIQWPAWWDHEKVDFEPGGKDHYTEGGSRITANEIFEEIYQKPHPVDLKYDFITLKDKGGKMASSVGDVIRIKDVLEIYEPEIVRFLFAGTKPNKEFFISFDLDVIKNYEDFDKAEEIYFSKRKSEKQKRIYELSCVDKVPKTQQKKLGFRHLTILLQIYENNLNKVVKKYGAENKKRAECALNWLEKYAPDDYKFEVQENVNVKIGEKEKIALRVLADRLKEKKFTEKSLFEEFYKICEEAGIKNTDFFRAAYQVLIAKDRGPRLAPFILILGQKRAADLFEKIK